MKEHSLWSDEADSSSADEDQQPLLSPGIQKRPHRNLSRSRDRLLSAAYFGVMAINGGMIGAFGPSLQMLERATGLTEYEVGKFVMQNRVSKLVGTLAWCGYAKLVQDERRLGRMRGKLTHQLMACMLATTALFSLVIGNLASSGTALQFSLICWGFVYGVTDSGVTSLTLWRWAHDDRRRRFDVALLNSGFTVGALITPVLVAASLRYGGGRWTFDVIAAAAVGLCALFPYLPNASVPLSTAEEAEAAAADMLKSVGSPEWRRTSDDSSAEQDSPPARIGSSSRQFSRLAGQQAVDLVRVARQKLGVLGAPTDDVKHQVGATTRLVWHDMPAEGCHNFTESPYVECCYLHEKRQEAIIGVQVSKVVNRWWAVGSCGEERGKADHCLRSRAQPHSEQMLGGPEESMTLWLLALVSHASFVVAGGHRHCDVHRPCRHDWQRAHTRHVAGTLRSE